MATEGPFGNGQPEPDDPGNALIDLLAPNFLPAYIEVQVVSAPTPDATDNGPFDHNVNTNDSGDPVTRPLTLQDVAIHNEVPFWVVQLYGAYEGLDTKDYDSENAFMLGKAYSGTNIAYVFHETIRDVSTNAAGAKDQDRLERRTALHEVGHLMGLYHTQILLTVMNTSVVATGEDADNKFSNYELGIIQSQPKPEGVEE